MPSIEILNGNTIHLSCASTCTVRMADLPGDGPYAFQMRIRSNMFRTVTVAPGNQAIDVSATPKEQSIKTVFPRVGVADNPYLTMTFPQGEYWIMEIQIEEGNVVTGWKLSTEDVVGSLNAALEQAESNQRFFVRVSTDGSTPQKVPDMQVPGFSLSVGVRIACLMIHANTVDHPTLNVNGTGEYAIVTSSGTVLSASNSAIVGWTNNSLVTFIWDGRFWRIDDNASLVKIDNILTENIVGTHGWINLGGGIFNFDNKLVWDGDTLQVTGNIVGSYIDGGEVHGAILTGEMINISSETVPDHTSATATKPLTRTGVSVQTYIDPDETGFPSVIGDFDGGSYYNLQIFAIKVYTANDDDSARAETAVTVFPQGARIDTIGFFEVTADNGTDSNYLYVDPEFVHIRRDLDVDKNIDCLGDIYEGGATAANKLSNKYNAKATVDYALSGNSSAVPDVNLASGSSWTNLGSISLPAGKHLLIVYCEFDANATGRRGVNLSTASGSSADVLYQKEFVQACSSGATTVRLVAFLNLSSTTTYYINAVQNSGSALRVQTRIAGMNFG